MLEGIRQVDRLLRGSYTKREDLAAGKLQVPVRTLVVAGLVLGALYGVFMGLYAVLRPGSPSFGQLVATTFKVPLLFLLTLLVTFPSLYVFSALSGSRLGTQDTLKLLLAAVAVDTAVLASFGPVTGFFTLSTDSYAFMIVLNVGMFTIAGSVGLLFLWRALVHLFRSMDDPAEEQATEETAGGRHHTSNRPRMVLTIWTAIFALVGAQMGWILRPFIGSPDLPFEIFRHREGSFFRGFFGALARLLGG